MVEYSVHTDVGGVCSLWVRPSTRMAVQLRHKVHGSERYSTQDSGSFIHSTLQITKKTSYDFLQVFFIFIS